MVLGARAQAVCSSTRMAASSRPSRELGPSKPSLAGGAVLPGGSELEQKITEFIKLEGGTITTSGTYIIHRIYTLSIKASSCGPDP
jgi:hypothetical protein